MSINQYENTQWFQCRGFLVGTCSMNVCLWLYILYKWIMNYENELWIINEAHLNVLLTHTIEHYIGHIKWIRECKLMANIMRGIW